MNSKEVINDIRLSGGIDYHYVERCAKYERLTPREYFYVCVKNGYNVHGNVARAVVRYFYRA